MLVLIQACAVGGFAILAAEEAMEPERRGTKGLRFLSNGCNDTCFRSRFRSPSIILPSATGLTLIDVF